MELSDAITGRNDEKRMDLLERFSVGHRTDEREIELFSPNKNKPRSVPCKLGLDPWVSFLELRLADIVQVIKIVLIL
jgi:hypothetical protein